MALKQCILILLQILLLSTQVSYGANILFFFGGGTYSHKIGIWPLVSALADRGHNVTLFSPFTKQPTKNPKVHDVSPPFLVESMNILSESDRLDDRQKQIDNQIWFKISTWLTDNCEKIVDHAETDPLTKSVLVDTRYDLMIINSIMSECGVIWASYHKTKFILSVSTSTYPWLLDIYGLPVETSWLPDLTLQHMSYPMTFFDRLRNFYRTLYMYSQRYTEVYPKINQLAQRVLKTSTKPDILAAEQSASLMLMNTYYGAEFGRSLPPFVIPVGGMQCWHPTKPLKPEIQKLLDDSEDGSIMISFGSSVEISNVSTQYVDKFIEAVRKFPRIQFLWKWDGAVPSNAPSNLYFTKWLPQLEILQHPKLLTFITHCGLNSKMEAICSGVPVIAMPLFGEQDYNAYHVQIYKLGVVIEARDLTTTQIANAIREVTTNKIYNANMKKAQQIFRDRYLNPIDTSIFWTEFVLRNEDTSLLKPLNLHQTWWQKRLLDIVAFLLVGPTLAVFTFAYLLHFAIRTFKKYSQTILNHDNVQSSKLKASVVQKAGKSKQL